MGVNAYPPSSAGAARLVTKSGSSGAVQLVTNCAGSGVSGTLGAWQQLTASSGAEWALVGIAATFNSIGSSGDRLPLSVAIATGGAGSEVAICNVPVIEEPASTAGDTTVRPGDYAPLTPALRVASGTRLSAAVALATDNGGTINVRIALVYVPWANLEGN